MPHEPQDQDDRSGDPTESSEVEGTQSGADAVPDKTTGTATSGAGFDDDGTDTDDRADATAADTRED